MTVLSISGREGSSKPYVKQEVSYVRLPIPFFLNVCLVPIPGSLAQSVPCLSIPLVCRLYVYLSLVRKPVKAI